MSDHSAVQAFPFLFSAYVSEKKNFSCVTSKQNSSLLVTESGQCIFLQLLVPFFVRAKVVSDVVVEPPILLHTHSPPTFFQSHDDSTFFPASHFTGTCPSFRKQQSLEKIFCFRLLLFLLTAPLKLLPLHSLSCTENNTQLFVNCK